MAEHEHEPLFTPPYLSSVQPIERLWACCCAWYQAGRPLRELFRQTHEDVNAGGNKHAVVEAQLRASMIEHSHSFCNHLIEQDDALSGTIDDPATESNPVQLDVDEDIEADMDPFPGAEVGEEEQV